MKIYRATNLPGSVQRTYRNPCSKPTVPSEYVTGFAQQVVDLSTFFHRDPLYRATNLPCRRLSCGEPTASVQQTYRAFRSKNEPCNEPTAYRALNLPSWHMVIHSPLHSWASFLSLFCSIPFCSDESIFDRFRQLNVFVQQTYCRPSIVQ